MNDTLKLEGFIECEKRLLGLLGDLEPPQPVLEHLLDSDAVLLGRLFLEDWRALVRGYFAGSRECLLAECETLLNLTWEKLNTGCWKEVPECWRRVYTGVSLVKLFSSLTPGRDVDGWKSLLRVCDMALLMGAPLPGTLLTRLATHLHTFLWKVTTPGEYAEEDKMEERAEPPPGKKPRLSLPDRFVAFPGERIGGVERIELPSVEQFVRLMRRGEPVVLTHCVDHWPATAPGQRGWSLRRLRRLAGYRTVPVEVGASYADDNWSQRLMTIADFIDAYFSTADQECHQRPLGYLAQHQLFAQIPELAEDIVIPDYCLCRPDDDVLCQPVGDVSHVSQPADEVSDVFEPAGDGSHPASGVLDVSQPHNNVSGVRQPHNVSDLRQAHNNISDVRQPHTNISDVHQLHNNVSDIGQPHNNVSDVCQSHTNVSDACRIPDDNLDVGLPHHDFRQSDNVSDVLKPHDYVADMCQPAHDILNVGQPHHNDVSDAGHPPPIDINAWFGPGGTVSPLHHDMKYNLLVQVKGEKYVKLYGTDQTPYLYAHEGSFLGNTSRVDAEHPDLTRFPLFARAVGRHLVLRRGEMLYLPPKHWHYVRSLTPSFSVNFWW